MNRQFVFTDRRMLVAVFIPQILAEPRIPTPWVYSVEVYFGGKPAGFWAEFPQIQTPKTLWLGYNNIQESIPVLEPVWLPLYYYFNQW